MPLEKQEYLEKLRARKNDPHVHRKHQLVGLQVAELLHDGRHKALYIKLAKERNPEKLLELAKSIAERKHITKKGAYFMACISAVKSEKDMNARKK